MSRWVYPLIAWVLVAGAAVTAGLEPCDEAAPDGGIYRVEPVESGFRLSLDCSRYHTTGVIPPRGGRYLALVDQLASASGKTAVQLTGRLARELACTTEWVAGTPDELLKKFLASAGVDLVVDGDYLLIGEKEKLEEQKVVIFAYAIAPPADAVQLELERTARLLLRQLPVRYWSDIWGDRVWLALGYYRVPGEGNTFLVVATQGHETPMPGHLLKVRFDTSDEVECLWSVPGSGQLIPEVIEDFDNDGVRDYVLKGPTDTGDWPNLILSGADGRRLLEFGSRALAVERTPEGVKRLALGTLYKEEQRDDSFVLVLSPESGVLVSQPAHHAAGANHQGEKAVESPAHIGKDNVAALLRAGADPANLYVYVFPDTKLHTYNTDVKVVRGAESRVWSELIDAAQAGWKPIDREDYPEITLLYVHERSKKADWEEE